MNIRLSLLALLVFLIVPVFPSAAVAADRFALVIGNAKYPDAEAPLKEPVNDARSVADELKRDGFTVDIGENLTGEGMRQAFERLYGQLKPGSVALVFFSGYGIQSNRQSFLIPVDAQIWTEANVRHDGFSLETVLNEMNNRGAGVKIALIDASRRNPFERRYRNFSAGLAPVIAPNSSLVMYSAALSSVIPDNGGDRSLFVQELLKEIRVPGLTAEETLNRTRVGVTRASRSEQVPWISSSLAEDFSFVPGPRPMAGLPQAAEPEPPPAASSPPPQPRVDSASSPSKADAPTSPQPEKPAMAALPNNDAPSPPTPQRPKVEATPKATPRPEAPQRPKVEAAAPSAPRLDPQPPPKPDIAAALAPRLDPPQPPKLETATPAPRLDPPQPPKLETAAPAPRLDPPQPPKLEAAATPAPRLDPPQPPKLEAATPAPRLNPPQPPKAGESATPAPPEKPVIAALPNNAASPASPPSPPTQPTQAALADDPVIRILSARITDNPDDAGALYRRGQVYASKGAYSLAVKDFDGTIRLSPKDAEAFNNRCWARAVIGDLQPALRDCNEALRLRPNFVDALDSRGLVNLKSGLNKNAIADFDAALKINPRLTSSLYGRGLARQRTGSVPEGEVDINNAKAMDPNIVKEFSEYGVR